MKYFKWALFILIFIVSSYLEESFFKEFTLWISDEKQKFTVLKLFQGVLYLSLIFVFPILKQGLWFWSRSILSFDHLFFEKIKYAIKESMRAMGSVIAWGLLFIIPGVIRYFQLVWVNFIVFLDPKYLNDQVDALRQSKLLWKLSYGGVIFIVLVFNIILPMLFQIVLDQKPKLILILAELITFLIMSELLYRVWKRKNKNLGQESV